MADGILHRFGMHGKSVVPLILGYGCNVPAIMALRGLEHGRDRTLTMLIIPFISCSARTMVVLALVGKYLGGLYATLVFAGNIGIALMVSFFLSRFSVDTAPGIIMDVPPLRQPYVRIVARKVWARVYDFFVFAWPVIVVFSVILSLLSHAGIDGMINRVFSPLTTGILDLPDETGITLFLGIFRKEFTLIMLNQALGTTDVASVLTQVQILVLTVFTVLYIPCVSTLAVLWKEGGWKITLSSICLNTVVALGVAGGLSFAAGLFR
ncbi:ferrous iron transporter B [bacterium]|nr:ferrous iron transporter B [bacterium]